MLVWPKWSRGYWPKATKEGIYLYSINFQPWEKFARVRRSRLPLLPHLHITIKGYRWFEWSQWRLPLYFKGANAFLADVERFAPPGSPFREYLELAPAHRHRFIYSVFVWSLPIFGILPLLLPALLITYSNRFSETYFHRPEFSANAIRVAPLLMADRESLRPLAFLKRGSAGTADASEFLNPLLGIDFQDKQKPAILKIPESWTQELQRDRKNWQQAKINWELSPGFFSWMKRLHDFDHWNMDKKAVADSRQKADDNLIEAYGKVDQQQIILLRLLKGKHDGDLQGAVRDADKLARLIWTLDDKVSVLRFIAMQKAIVEFATENALPAPEFDQKTLAVMKRYFYDQGDFLDPRVPIPVLEQVLATDFGKCHLAESAIPALILYRDLFENEFLEFKNRLRVFIESTASECRDSYFRRLLKNKKFSQFDELQNGISKPPSSFHANPPGYKKSFGYLYASMTAGHFGSYCRENQGLCEQRRSQKRYVLPQ